MRKKCLHEQEIGSQFHVPMRPFDESRMTNPFDFLDFVQERLYHEVLRDIFAAICDKCENANEMQTIDNPILQDAREKRERV